MVGAVVGHLGPHRRPRLRLGHLEPVALAQLADEGRCRVVERDQGPERVEQDGPPPHATQCHVANAPLKNASAAADPARRAAPARGRRGELEPHPHVQREEDREEARQRHQGLRGDGIGERKRERREDVGAVGGRQAAHDPDHGRDSRQQEREQHEVVRGDDVRVPARGRETHWEARSLQQLPRTLVRRDDRVVEAAERPGEVAEPDVLCVERRRGADVLHGEVAHVRGQPRRDQREPGHVERDAVTRHPPSPIGSVGRTIRPRAVQVQERDRKEEEKAGAARRGRQRARDAGHRPPAAARGVERAGGQRQEERLAVHGREEEGHREEGERQNGRASRLPAQLQLGQPVDEHERHQEQRRGQEDARDDPRPGSPARDVQQQGVEREERDALVARVALVGNRQEPHGVPPRTRAHEDVTDPPEGVGEPGGVEVVAAVQPAPRQQRAHTRDPYDRPGEQESAPRVAERWGTVSSHGARPSCHPRRVVLAPPRQPPDRGDHRDRGLRPCDGGRPALRPAGPRARACDVGRRASPRLWTRGCCSCAVSSTRRSSSSASRWRWRSSTR